MLRLVLKFSLKLPDGIPPMQSCIEIFVPPLHSGCLDWTWWKDSLATLIACFNTAGLFCVRYVEHKVFLPPLPESLEELWARITEAVVTRDAEIFIGFGTKSFTDMTSAA